MFTPIPSFVGGLLLSYSTSTLLISQGRVLGCSGVTHSTIAGCVIPESEQNSVRTQGWKWATTAGLLAGGAILRIVRPNLESWVGASIFDDPSVWRTANLGLDKVLLAGFLVGAGTKLANGCTSGHMLVGLARKSKRSLAAVITFFSAALLTATRIAPLPASVLASNAAASVKPFVADLYDAPPPLVAFLIIAAPVLSSLPSVAYSLPVSPRLRSAAQSFFLGMTFSVGLALAGMTRPSKVLGFFYLPHLAPAGAPAWDPSLMMVALGGLVPNFLVWNNIATRCKRPTKEEKWECPSPIAPVDRKLLVGSAMFGVGWGMMGICPGPLLAVLGAGPGIATSALLAFAGMFALGGLVARPF